MSIQAVGWALEQDLPARPKLVLVAIANHANHADGYCWLNADTIAAEAACTPRSVYRFVGSLVRNDYVRKARRKGADGKQRANDYWILFNREQAAWDWGAGLTDEQEPDVTGEVGEEPAAAKPESRDTTQVIVSPGDTVSHGKDASPVLQQNCEMHAQSLGPCDNRVTRNRIAEPSKTNPENGLAPAKLPRGYRRPPLPPPQPLGSTTLGGTGESIFVYQPSRAYDAWKKYKRATSGNAVWNCSTTKTVNGRLCFGWYFPTLFPPEVQPPPKDNSFAPEKD
jgi:hypothetical protein